VSDSSDKNIAANESPLPSWTMDMVITFEQEDQRIVKGLHDNTSVQCSPKRKGKVNLELLSHRLSVPLTPLKLTTNKLMNN
jgi:hypothetical protein